jgi:predicted glycoside hydrolase/deacetylase ChbG (UPF0249 family)
VGHVDRVHVGDHRAAARRRAAAAPGGGPPSLRDPRGLDHVPLDLATRLGVPVRHFSAARYLGEFYGQTAKGEPLPDLISVPVLVATLEQLPEGVTELGCHPSTREDLDTMYLAERIIELATLCDPRVRAAVNQAGIQPINFAELRDQS